MKIMKIKRFETYSLNEKAEEYDFEFITQVDNNNTDFEDVELNGEQYVTPGALTVNWFMDFDNRKFGINSMAPVVTKIVGTYSVVTPTDGEDIEETVEFVADKKDWEFICELQTEFKFGDGISVASVGVDLKSKKISVQFG
jgi:hypothetical protein